MNLPPRSANSGSAGYRPLPSRADGLALEEQTNVEIVYQQRSSRVSYRWFVILWIIAMLSASFHENIHIRLGGNKPFFNFFLFSQQTSAGYCLATGHCKPDHIRPYWTIHGLWPSNDTSWPQMCNMSVKFNLTELDPIRADLDAYWPSVLTENSGHFWTHEWQKHGSCALQVAPLSGVFNYFNTTLSLARIFNVTNFLLDADIVPTTNRTYSVAELQKALTTDLRSRANIVCRRVNGFPYPVLSEVRFCLSKSDLKPIDCKLKHEQCGDGPVHYVPVGTTDPILQLGPWSQLLVNVFSLYVKYLSPV